MKKSYFNSGGNDTELIAVLNAISHISARMARNMTILAQQRQSEKGERRYSRCCSSCNLAVVQCGIPYHCDPEPHKNGGHLDQYYVPDHHEAIISHEDFEAAAALIEQRASEKGIKKGNTKYQQRYAFSSKIICSECGNTFRRRIHSSTYGKYAAWVCNTHLEDTSRCSMLYIRDDDLKLAFTTMINKLVYCHKLVLKPYLKALQENTGDASLLNIQQLEMLLEQNTEQRETLHKLMGQGYIDQILFTQENNVLLSQAGEYRNQIELLNRSQSLDATKVYETERLLHFCERGEMQLEYSEELFELFVDHIEVYSRQKIGFALHCGLILKEMI